jgi:hypothetical protein
MTLHKGPVPFWFSFSTILESKMPAASLLLGCRQRLESLLWSLWSELGVPGWERKHKAWWIDPEELLLFTATVDPIDPRLREEAVTWCLRHRRFLSEARVKSLLGAPRFGEPSHYQPQLGRFLATVSIARSLGLGESQQPYRVRPASTSLNRAALLSLRLRSLLGVTAKAEVIRVFLARSGVTLTANDLVGEGVGYTKRAIRDALEDLRMGGFAELEESGNRKGYRLLVRKSFFELLGSRPVHFPRWGDLFAVLRGVLDLTERIDKFRPATRPIEIRRSLAALDSEIRGAGLLPPILDVGSDVVEDFGTWVGELFDALA